MKWLPIDTRPTRDSSNFLVRVPRWDDADGWVALEVDTFEGQMYPSHLVDSVDWDDRVANATHWCPLPSLK